MAMLAYCYLPGEGAELVKGGVVQFSQWSDEGLNTAKRRTLRGTDAQRPRLPLPIVSIWRW